MKFLILLLLSFNASASFTELFGPSAESMAVGNLPITESASSNSQAAALLGFSEKTKFSFSTFYLSTNFNDINGVVTKSETNTVNQQVIGDVEVNPTPSTLFGAHLSTPLFSPQGVKFNLSVVAPFDRLMEADTGDPYQPSYVMYANRFLRPSIHASVSQAFDDLSFSLGVMTGFQSNGETYIVTRTTSGNPSVGKVSFNAKPSLGLTASVAKKWDKQLTYLAFQQEMESKFISRATGETEISGGAAFPFDFKVNSILFYDPMTFRLGHQLPLSDALLHLGIEYQLWENYEAATLELKKQGGDINGSENFEVLKPKNIWIPRIGLEKSLSEKWKIKGGYFYRPTPLKPSRLKYAGNSIDSDKHVASLGLTHLLDFQSKLLNLDVAWQGHFLKTHKVTKTPGQEDGVGPDPKIGSPGYTVGGMIHVLTVGISWNY